MLLLLLLLLPLLPLLLLLLLLLLFLPVRIIHFVAPGFPRFFWLFESEW